MIEQFVPHEIALELKKLGFNEPCFAMWTNGLSEFEYGGMMLPRIFSSKFRLNDTQSCQSYLNNPDAPFGIAAPTFSQAFKFFREKYKLFHPVNIDDVGQYYFTINKKDFCRNSYEEAELECLVELIDIVKKQKLQGKRV